MSPISKAENNVSVRWWIVIIAVLALPADASIRENLATFVSSCDDSVMNVQMIFTHPFKGRVFTPHHFFNPNCSYAASPDSTSKKVRLALPHVSCGMKLLNASGQLLLQNTLIIVHHHLLDTVYDYNQNVTCRIDNPISETQTHFETLKVESKISFTHLDNIISEEEADSMGLGGKLIIAYQVREAEEYQDMVVMNCLAHDDRVINKKTAVHQLSNPFGCASETDVLSGFRVLKAPDTGYDMTAFSPIRNMSLFARRRIHVTCAAKLCKDTCERKCDSNDQQGTIYFDDIARLGLVFRRPGSRNPPPSLAQLDRFDRQRRSHKQENVYQELDLIAPNFTVRTDRMLETVQPDRMLETVQPDRMLETVQPDRMLETLSVSESDNLTQSSEGSTEVYRIKRSVNSLLNPQLNVILIESDHSVLYTVNNLDVDSSSLDIYSGTNFSALDNNTVTKVKLPIDTEPPTVGKYGNAEQIIRVFVRAVVALFVMLCISAAAFSLFSYRRGLTVYMSPSDL